MYHLNSSSVVKRSTRSRQPLKHLPKTYANRMSLPSGGPPTFTPMFPAVNNTAVETPNPSHSATASVHSNDNQTPPLIDFTAPSLDIPEQSYQRDRQKRMKTDQGYSVSPGIDVAGDEDTVVSCGRSMASGDNARIGSTTKDGNPESLALPEDKRHLTELHCFVRRNNVYLFCADENEVGVPKKGRKKSLTLGQVGLGCTHCRYSVTKLKSSTYFPSSISGIYNATMIIQQRHFPVCPSVSKEIHVEYNKLKVLTARSASTKEYWVWAARKLGLVDTNEGVFFHSNDNQTANSPVILPQVVSPDKLRTLVESSDKVFATEYAFYVLSQMTTCHFTESDRLGKRKRHVVGFPGLACRYCYGGNGSGRFFPLTLKTFSDVSKSLYVLSNHLQKCPKCPHGMSTHVKSLAEVHEVEKVSQPFGSQKIFFELIWKRLHPDLTSALSDEQARTSLNSEEYPSPPSELIQIPRMFATDEKIPSIQTETEKKTSVLHKDGKNTSRTCRIPKKRYCVQSSSNMSTFPANQYPQEQTLTENEYSETDMSAAMILATGFERDIKRDDSHEFEAV
eukprot:scaffold13166_cov139-Skeletonema_menzelii.AAC.9